MRKSGILLHISSLPSRYGIGRMGKSAYDFVDFLHMSETAYWQILPLSPTSYGDSPYQSFSVYAGNPYFIDFADLEEQGLLMHGDYTSMLWQRSEESIDYELLYHSNIAVLRRAYARFKLLRNKREYNAFVRGNRFWLDDYALFMALKAEHSGAPWYEWEKPLAMRDKNAVKAAKERLADEIEMYCFIQFTFAKQWKRLKAYANSKHVSIIGDMPIYVAYDSSEVWVSPELFALDKDKKPIEVAGCPPDPFAPEGQLWGNPLYDWDYHKKTGYAWWISRLKHAASLYDCIRIDHFRGFESYYAIPYGSPDATNGKWRKGPNKQLFLAMKREVGDVHIIAEDLGFITPAVRRMLQALQYPGMKVLQFGFDSDPDNEHLPHNFTTPRCVCYTGTHDNETLRGWVEAADKTTIKYAKRYLRCKKSEIPDAMIAACWGSIAEIAIAQMQDFLSEDSDCRMNTPSTLGGNWMYRTEASDFTTALAKSIRKLNRTYGRSVRPEKEADAPKTEIKADAQPVKAADAPETETKADARLVKAADAPETEIKADARPVKAADAPETEIKADARPVKAADAPKTEIKADARPVKEADAPAPETTNFDSVPHETSDSIVTISPETPPETPPEQPKPKRKYTRRKKPDADTAAKPKRSYTRRTPKKSETAEETET